MRVHVLQHVPFEGLGSIQSWLDTQQASIAYTPFFESSALPNPAHVDFIIALGGSMSVNDETALPWLKDEKRFIAQAVSLGKPVLGICLGAQLIASAHGARVYPGAEKEIGWFPITACGGSATTFKFPASIDVFHWHGETFDLPKGAVHLARSEVCRNQAFQIGTRVIGLQFHLETTPESADAIITNCRDELATGQFVQSEEALRAVGTEQYAGINRLMEDVLSFLTRPEV